jgi:PEGA domain
MDSPLDQSRDPLLAFASEASVEPTADREPAFLRIPTPHDGHLSITSIAAEPPGSQTVRARPMTTVALIIGILAGFAGGYAFADRIIAPAVTPVHPIATPASAPEPARTAAAAPTVAPVASSESAKPSAEPSTEPAREPDVVKATKAANASVTSAPSARSSRSSTPRASSPSSTTRPSTIPRPRPAVAPTTTAFGGAIEIMSRPRDAQVFLDGVFVGRAPMSIPDVPEGVHQVRVELDGFSPWVGSVRVKGGSRARVGASLER